ncbi:MAG: GNAT family N-acetyltransferase [bacterium]
MLSPATLGRRYLNETVSARGGARLRIMERPTRWMAPEEIARVVADLQTVVTSAVSGGALDYGVASGDPARLDAAIITLAYARDGRPVGFNALTIMECELRGEPVDVLHLGLVVIDPAYRAGGLAGALYGLAAFLLFARRQLRPLWISNVTQVPAVFGMVADAFDGVFPTSESCQRQRYDHAHLARQIMSRYRYVFGVGEEAVYDERRGVIMNAYTGGSDNLKKSFDDAPKHRTAHHNETCRRELDYGRGDDFLQLGQVTLRAARSYFTRSASVISPAALAMQFGSRVLESLVAPLVQWFDPHHRMGDLRPVE